MPKIYTCAVVEVEPDIFKVVIPGDVSTGQEALVYYDFQREAGKYANLTHLIVRGGKDVDSIEIFRGDVATVVRGLIATQSDSSTLDRIQEALQESQYIVRKVYRGQEATASVPDYETVRGRLRFE